jgi:hypothetical protein
MGERQNIVVVDGEDEVYLYTHWKGGDQVLDIVQKVLKRGECLRDNTYLARILFQELVGSDKSDSGYGISSRQQDFNYPNVVLDVPSQMVRFEEAAWGMHEPPTVLWAVPFAEFAQHGGKTY